MTDMDGLLILLFASKLTNFLNDPVIRVEFTPSEEVSALKQQVQSLEKAYDTLQIKYQRLVSQYGDEVNRCLFLEDFCRANGLKIR